VTVVPSTTLLLVACPGSGPVTTETDTSSETTETSTSSGPLTLDGSSTGGEPCPMDQVVCGEGCVDLGADPLHCGECFSECEASQVCIDGECSLACEDFELACDGVCVDIESHSDHCGGCNTVCDDLEECVSGTCEFGGCEFGRPCGGTCVVVESDLMHCGGCDQPCPTGGPGEATCMNGECGYECPEGLGDCDPEVDGCEADLTVPATCGACDHPCDDGDTCEAPDCVHAQELVGNGDLAAGIAGWTIDNNPIDSGDAFANFVVSGGELTVFPAEGPHAKVVYQDVMIPPGPFAGAVFSVCFYQDTGGQDPENVVEIQTDPFDEDGDGFAQNALRIDLVDPLEDVFVAPAIVALFAPTTPIGSPAMCVTSTFEDAALPMALSDHAGQSLRLRIAHVESTFAWDLELDDVSLVVEQVY
jgi:hypothetical protein